MNSTEYVKLDPYEKMFGEKGLLEAQLSLLNALKSYKQYEKIRQEELLLKISLRRKITETQEELSTLNKLLPKVPVETDENDFLPKGFKEFGEPAKEKQETSSRKIELELDDIKRKLERLS